MDDRVSCPQGQVLMDTNYQRERQIVMPGVCLVEMLFI